MGLDSRSSPASSLRSTSWLVGREAELAALRRHLAEHRLVTVTGAGGVGKTALAMAAISDLPGPVVCELADVESPDAVRHAVAAKLGVVLRPGDPVGASLAAAPDGAGLLVVLDNCEHVADAAAEVAEQVLASGPHVHVLATSREPLRLPEERVMVLAPLAVPASPDDDAAADTPAVVLFAERARRADPAFELDADTLPDVVRICRSLDGIPLAIEIAAARVRVMAVRDMVDRLSRRFSLLRSGTRHTPERHRSLRAVVDWSYDLLEPGERDLFTTLAVHPAGCDLPAVMAAGQAVGIDVDDVVDVLEGLVAKSLMTVSPTPLGGRYGMLETLREYGLERLAEAGALSTARDRHAGFYAALARSLRDALVRAWTAEAVPLFVEFDNIRSALTWTLENDESPDRSFDLLAPLWYVALQRNGEEVAELADRALQRWPDPRHGRWSEVAGTAAAARAMLEDYEGARVLGQAAAEATHSSPVGRAFGCCALADVAFHAGGDAVAALGHLDRADEAAATAGFEPLRCDIMGRRAQMLAQAGHADEALATAERARAMALKQGNSFELAWSQHLIGLLLVRTDPDAAHEWLTRALEESRALLYPYGTSSSLRGLGLVAAARGDLPESAALFSEALDGFIRAGHLGERWNTLAALLSLLVAAGRRQSAAALIVGLDSAGVVVTRIHAPLLDDLRADLAPELGTSRITARGRAMSPEQVLAVARNELRRLRRAEGGVDVPQQRSAAEATAELRREGDLWRATYAGTTVHLPDLRGVRDLAVLLAQAGREVPVLDLVTPTNAHRRRGDPTGAVDVIRAPGDLGERIDARARAEYAARVRELQAELDEADVAGDPGRGAHVQEELDFLTRELSAAYGLHGPRRAGDPTEKARTAVTARIRAAIAKIGDAHPDLGRHLRASVRTGRFCSYRPEQPTTWIVAP